MLFMRLLVVTTSSSLENNTQTTSDVEVCSILHTKGGSAGNWVVGFFFPIAGFVIWYVQQNSQPKRAASAAQGALFGFALGFILFLLFGSKLTAW